MASDPRTGFVHFSDHGATGVVLEDLSNDGTVTVQAQAPFTVVQSV